jgi:cysteine desulfurase
MKKRIYMDYAASTPLDARVLDEMTGFYRNHWGNSAAVHSFGKFLQQRIDEARSDFAAELNADASGIIFTSSATESNNTVLFGLPQKDAGHIIISNIEHPSIEKAADILREKGWEITLIKADKTGYVNPDDVRASIKPQTALVSVQYVNNELGTIQPIEEIGQICKENSVLFHTDAAQGFGKLKIDVKKCHIDFLSASSQKIYGPLGAGLLYIGPGLSLKPLLIGGGQENGRRASTVNVPAIIGFAKALEIYIQDRKEDKNRISRLKDSLLDFILSDIPKSQLNGRRRAEECAYNIINVSFKNTDNELLAMQLDREGFAVSTGSACSSGKVKVSRILKACGIADDWARGALRISLGRKTSEEEIEQFKKVLLQSVKKVRKI